MDVFIQILIFIFYVFLSFSMSKLIYILFKYNRYVIVILPSAILIVSVVFFVIGWLVNNTYIEIAILILFVFVGSMIASIEKFIRKWENYNEYNYYHFMTNNPLTLQGINSSKQRKIAAYERLQPIKIRSTVQFLSCFLL